MRQRHLFPLLALLAIPACAAIDVRQQEICEALVPVMEPADAHITLQRTTADPAAGITIEYRIGEAPAPQRLKCMFAGTGLDADKLSLRGVETATGSLSRGQVMLLNETWLRDAESHRIARTALAREGEALAQGWVRLSAESGYFWQQVINAGPPTALYALLALAYSLVYGLTNRINLAFGEIATIGAYGALIGVLLALGFGQSGAAVALPMALVAAVLVAGGIGGAIGQRIFLPLIGRASQPLLVATIGLAIFIQEFLARAEGVRERWLQPIFAEPHLVADGPFQVVATTMQVMVSGVAIGVVVAVILAMRLTPAGRMWRAVADDRLMARMLGIDTDAVIVASFVVASMLAALGGAILTLYYGGTSFAMGTSIGLKALVAAIIGGIGSLPGAALGGLVLGLTESLWSAYEPIVWRDGVTFGLLIVFLVLKPEGLLGTKRALEERDERP